MPHKSREDYNEYMRKYNLNRFYQRKEKAIAQLGGKCVDCGSTENLEFDHVDPTTKSFTIGRAIGNIAESKLQEELAKCELRCVECHVEKSIKNGDIPPRATHGTYAMYRHHKCRCDKCREAARIDRRISRQKVREKKRASIAQR